MRVTEINTVLRTVEYAGEFFINLQEFNDLLKTGMTIEMEEVLITPYYIQGNKRLELYQYEFCCTSDCDFSDYILRQTGIEHIWDVPEEILYIRNICFTTVDEPNGLSEFFEFLFGNKALQKEVVQTFGNYVPENLYAIVY